MQHQPPHLSPPGGSCVAPRLVAVVGVAALSAPVAVAVPVVAFARTLAAPSQS